MTLDGQPVAADDLRLELGGRAYRIDEIGEQSETLWYLQEHPLLVIRRDDPVALGDTVQVGVIGELRLPYMQIAPGQDGGPGMYVPQPRAAVARAHGDRPRRAAARDRLGRPAARPDASADPFQLGITLYSASAEFRAGWYDFDGLLDRVAELRHRPRHRDRRLAGDAEPTRS